MDRQTVWAVFTYTYMYIFILEYKVNKTRDDVDWELCQSKTVDKMAHYLPQTVPNLRSHLPCSNAKHTNTKQTEFSHCATLFGASINNCFTDIKPCFHVN